MLGVTFTQMAGIAYNYACPSSITDTVIEKTASASQQALSTLVSNTSPLIGTVSNATAEAVEESFPFSPLLLFAGIACMIYFGGGGIEEIHQFRVIVYPT